MATWKSALRVIASTCVALPFGLSAGSISARTLDEPRVNREEGGDAPRATDGGKTAFDKAYRLDPGQVLKRIPPPHIPERLTYYRAEHQGQAKAIPEPPTAFFFHVSPEGAVRNWGMSFSGDTFPLRMVLEHSLQLKSYEFEGPADLLSLDLVMDWVVRPEAKPADKLMALSGIIRQAHGRLARFEQREVERDVIVASGQFAFKALPARNRNSVVLYTGAVDANSGGGGGSGDLVEFLKMIGNRTGETVFDDVKGERPAHFNWEHQSSAYLTRLKGKAERPAKLRELLDNISGQTGLRFETGRRKVPVWFVVEGPAAG